MGEQVKYQKDCALSVANIIARGDDLATLHRAIETAKQAGVTYSELERALAREAELEKAKERRAVVCEDLKRASSDGEAEALHAALDAAEEVGVSHDIIDIAAARLQDLESLDELRQKAD